MGLWDQLYYYDNDSIEYEVPIDMKGKKIKGVGDGTSNSDAVNVKQLNSEIEKVNSEIENNNPIINNNKKFISLILNYILKNENKFSLIKELYFPDNSSAQIIGTHNYAFKTIPYDYEDQITFYYAFKHNSSTSGRMLIQFFYLGGRNPLYIKVGKTTVELDYITFNIPNICLGKQVWFWIWIKNNYFSVIFSGVSPKKFRFTTGFKNLSTVRIFNTNLFPKVRGLITKNIYDNKSKVYLQIKRFEESEGTIT